MKTIIENATNLSKYLVSDDSSIMLLPNAISVIVKEGATVTDVFSIADLNENNSTVVENVTAPTDWVGNKYTCENNVFTINPNWVEPTEGGE